MARSDRGTRRDRANVATFGWLVLLLVIPSIALGRRADSIDWRVLVGGPFVLSVFSFFSYRSDKRRAEVGERRIAESALHLADFIGGWPGGFIAQRAFRHKIGKGSFQFIFWSSVLFYEFLAADSLLGWRFTGHAMRFIKSQIA